MKKAVNFLIYYIPFQLYRWNKKEQFLTFGQIAAIMFFQYGLAIYVYITDYSGMQIDSMIYSHERRQNAMSALVMLVLFILPILFYYFNKQNIKFHYLKFIKESTEIQIKKKKLVHVFIWVISPLMMFVELCLLNYYFK